MGKEEDDAIYIIIFNKRPKAVNAQKKKKKRPCSAAHFVGDDRLVAVLFLEMNEGKREHLICLSMSPTQKASGVLQRFGLDKSNSTIIISGADAHFVLEEELGDFPRDEHGVLQMTIKPRRKMMKDDEDRICHLGSRMTCIII